MKLIEPYIPLQIKAEEQYYNEYKIFVDLLISYLLGIIDNDKFINAYKLKESYNKWINNHSTILNKFAHAQAYKMITIANTATGSNTSLSNVQFRSIYRELEVWQINTLQAVFSEIMKLLPIGVAGLYAVFYTDETNRDDIYHRATNYTKRLCRNTYSTGVPNLIMYEGKLLGYKGYIANNQHDDKVRHEHQIHFDGHKIILFNKPPSCGHVGTETNCRCYIIGFV